MATNTNRGKHLRQGTYAHIRPTDIVGISLDQSALPAPIPTVNVPPSNGFDSRETSEISFVDATRVFTIEPVDDAFYFWSGGEHYKVTEALTLTIPDVEGVHYVYFDTNGILQTTSTFTIETLIEDAALVAYLYWDATNSQAILVNDERHGRMDPQTHIYLHTVFGSQWVSGLSLLEMNVDQSGDDDTSAQFAVEDGSIRDEDILQEIADGDPQELNPIAQIPMFYRDGTSGNWRMADATNFPIHYNSTTPAPYWNEYTGSTWQLTEVSGNDFVLTHYFALEGLDNQIIGLVGQTSYSTKAEAEEGAETEINDLEVGSIDILTPELVPLATVIWQVSNGYSNTVGARIVSTDDGSDYVDWRVSTSSRSGVSSSLIAHNSTLSRDAANAHPISAITDLTSELSLDTADITASRPPMPVTGQRYFDTTLGIPIWYDGSNWIDATGTTV